MSYNHFTLITPTLDTPTLSSGGDLEANTTYYFKVIAIKGTNYSTWGVGEYYSLPSNEVSITTDAINKTINLNWDDIAGADQYCVYRSTTSGKYTTALYLPPKITVAGFIDDGTYSPSSYGHFAPYDIKLNGQLVINSEGSLSVPITLEDIYEQDQANGWGIIEKHSDGVYEIHCYFYIEDSTYFTAKNEILIINGTLFLGNNCEIGERLEESSYTNGCSLLSKRIYKSLIFSGAKIYDTKIFSMLDGLQNYATCRLALYAKNGCQFQGNIVTGFRGIKFEEAATSAKDLIINTVKSNNYNQFGIANPTSMDTEFENIIVAGFSTGLQLENNKSGKFKGITLKNNGVDVYGYNNIENPLVVNTELSTVKMARSDVAQDGSIGIKYTFDLKVIDKNNGPINESTIIIKSANDEVALSLQTNTDGDISQQELYKLIYSISAGQTGQFYNYREPFLAENNYNPYTLEVRKAGYKTYKTTFILDKKIDWKITLAKVLDMNISKRVSMFNQ